jgi:hypothetical protein
MFYGTILGAENSFSPLHETQEGIKPRSTNPVSPRLTQARLLSHHTRLATTAARHGREDGFESGEHLLDPRLRRHHELRRRPRIIPPLLRLRPYRRGAEHARRRN